MVELREQHGSRHAGCGFVVASQQPIASVELELAPLVGVQLVRVAAGPAAATAKMVVKPEGGTLVAGRAMVLPDRASVSAAVAS